MNKKITVVTILFLFFSVCLISAPANEKEELYLKTVSEKNLETKMALLKEYAEKYGQNKDDKFIKYINLSMADTAYKLKNYDDAIKYGESVLSVDGLDPNSKLNLLFMMANSFYIQKKEMDKGFNYAGNLVDAVTKAIQQLETSGQDKAKIDAMVNNYRASFLAPAYKIQALILYSQGKDNLETLKKAAELSLKAYEADKSEDSYNKTFGFAVNLSQKEQYDEARAIVEKIMNKDNPKYNEASLLGKIYILQKDKDKAAHYFEISYKLKPDYDMAMRLGQMLNKTEPQKAARYFADAYVLKGMNKEDNSYKYLEQLYFNVLGKDKTPEEKEQGLNEIIEASRARLGK